MGTPPLTGIQGPKFVVRYPQNFSSYLVDWLPLFYVSSFYVELWSPYLGEEGGGLRSLILEPSEDLFIVFFLIELISSIADVTIFASRK